MTRIIGGVAKGRRLRVPAAGTRPTSDRAREALFSSLESLRGTFTGACVLDLYAGSGALGLEACSRGAAVVDLVDSDRSAVQVIDQNIRTVVGAPSDDRGDEPSEAGGRVTSHRSKVLPWLRNLDGPRQSRCQYDVVFLDPPYATSHAEVAEVLAALAAGVLAPGAVAVVERSSRDAAWEWSEQYEALRDVSYGEARIGIGQLR